MSEVNSFIIMVIMKIYRLSFKNPKKVFLLRLSFVLKFISMIIFSVLYKFKEKYDLQIIKNTNLKDYFKFYRLKFILPTFFFNFLAGSYPIGMMYFSITKEIIKLPFYLFEIW